MAIQDGRIQAQGLQIHYLHDGETGSPVLLLHGGGTDSARLSWGHLISPLAASFRVFAPDWPGYGLSDRPEIEYTMPFYISVLADLISALELHHPALIGISMGGAIALGYALDHPQTIKRLVLVDSYGLQDRAPAHRLSYLFVKMPIVNELSWAIIARSRAMCRASLRGIFHDPHNIADELVGAVFEELNRPGAGAAFRSFQKSEIRWEGMNTIYMDQLHKLTVPTLIVHGAHDGLVPLRFAREAHGRIPKSRLKVLPKAGHWAQREQPQEFLEAVSGFLAE